MNEECFQMVFSPNTYYVMFNCIQTKKKVSEIGYFYLTAIKYTLSLPNVTDWNQIQTILLLQHNLYGTVFIQEPRGLDSSLGRKQAVMEVSAEAKYEGPSRQKMKKKGGLVYTL